MAQEVRFAVALDPGDVVFEEDNAPFLAVLDHPEYGPLWVLYYMDEHDGVEDYIIGAADDDLDYVQGAARRHLDMLGR